MMSLGLQGRTLAVLALLAAAGAGGGAQAQSSTAATVYRCPGPPVLYTDAITASEAKEKGCRTIEGAPITVIAPIRARAGAGAGSPPKDGASAARGADSKVDPADQKARDSDARRILDAELKREEQRLEALKREFNNGEPERKGDERNFAKYQERVAEMKASIQRKESDIAALKREIAKLPPS